MGRILKIFFSIVALTLLLGVVAIVVVTLTFDINDHRDEIELIVEKNTGREFNIEGEIGMAVFPWLAIEVPHTELGNAAGFGEEPFISFDEANLSVGLWPLLFDKEVKITVAELVGLQVNLEVNAAGRSNWQDFIDAAEMRESMPAEQQAAPATPIGDLDIAGIEVLQSTINYIDAQAGTNISLADLNIVLGGISGGESGIRFDGFAISALLQGLTETPTTFALNTPFVDINMQAETVTLGDVDLDLLGLDIAAAVEPFSYSAELAPVAAISVAGFSLRNLMQRLDIEAPETTDPAALGKVSIAATAKLSASAIAMTDLELVLDDTTFTGALSIPQGNNDVFELQLYGDSIDLDRYMAPVTEGEGSSGAEDAAVEIPTDLIRMLNARGVLTLANAHLSGMQFENIELGVLMDDGKLRMHPMQATLFEGQYTGDVRIDASGNTPVLSVNERIENVQLGALAKAMFEQDNVSGTIAGSFELTGRGANLAAIQRDLNGNISLQLRDGALEGTDVWHELRKARATIRQEPAPEPDLPPRTRFSEVSASGPVTNGILRNDDFIALLPFMQLSGNGSVNFAEGTVDYQMSARVFESPELIGDDVTADELEDLSKTKIPIRISGSLADPSIKPDVQKLLEGRVREELEDKVKDKLKDLLSR